MFIKCIITAYICYLVATEQERLSQIRIMGWLWRCSFALLGVLALTVYWSMEFKNKDWETLFKKSEEVHGEFDRLGLSVNLKIVRDTKNIQARTGIDNSCPPT